MVEEKQNAWVVCSNCNDARHRVYPASQLGRPCGNVPVYKCRDTWKPLTEGLDVEVLDE